MTKIGSSSVALAVHLHPLTPSPLYRLLQFRCLLLLLVLHVQSPHARMSSKSLFHSFSLFLSWEVQQNTLTGPFGNSEFGFPSKLNVLLSFTLRNFQGHKRTKLTVSLELVIKCSIKSMLSVTEETCEQRRREQESAAHNPV